MPLYTSEEMMAKNAIGSVADNAAKARQGQDAKREARKQRRAQRENRNTISALMEPKVNLDQSTLHALYKETIHVLGAGYVSISPAQALRESREFKTAMRTHGELTCRFRIAGALSDKGVDVTPAANFLNEVFA